MTESNGDVTSAGDGRRRFLRLAGSAAVLGVAGCAGPGGDETTADGNETTEAEATEAETTETEAVAGNETDAAAESPDLSGPVPEQYATAASLGGTQRNPEALQTKEAVSYQSEPSEDQQCSGCTFYIEDMNGDGLGACAIVEGLIEPQGWCVSFAPYDG